MRKVVFMSPLSVCHEKLVGLDVSMTELINHDEGQTDLKILRTIRIRYVLRWMSAKWTCWHSKIRFLVAVLRRTVL